MVAINSLQTAYERAKQEHEKNKKWIHNNKVMVPPKSPMSSKERLRGSPPVYKRTIHRTPLPGHERRFEIPPMTSNASSSLLHAGPCWRGPCDGRRWHAADAPNEM